MHGVLDCIARNEDVSVKLRHRFIRHDEAVAVLVEDEPAFNFIRARNFPFALWRLGMVNTRRNLSFGLATWELVTTPGKFFNRPALL